MPNTSSLAELPSTPITPPVHIVLVEPEIAPNAGTIARLCAGTAARLHLVGRLGFRLDDRHLKRAGLDYWPHVDLHRHLDWAAFRNAWPTLRLIAYEAPTPRPHTAVRYELGDALVFGSESRGLPLALLAAIPTRVALPMITTHVRSLNLATVVAVGLYEALRQIQRWPGPSEERGAGAVDPAGPAVDLP